MALDTWKHVVTVAAVVACFSFVNTAKIDEEMWTKFMFKFQNHTTCGHRKSSMDDAMMPEDESEDDMMMMDGGLHATNAQEGEFPWHAAIFLHGHKVCGGALIHKEWLLTAASCLPFLKKPEAYTVVMGTTSGVHADIIAQDSPNKQYSMVEGLYVHPRYDARRWEYDLALVKVQEAFTINDYVNVVCLPLPMMQRHFQAGMKATVAAFGDPPMMMEPMCPDMAEGSFATCTDTCMKDSDCGMNEKCCGDECKQCVTVTAPTESPMEGAVMPGTLHKFKLPLMNVSTCHGLFNGDLATSLFCAGKTMMMGGDYQMKDGGLIAFLKKKMMKMKMMEMEMSEEDMMDDDVMMGMMERMKEEGGFNFDLLPILAHLQKSVDMMDGALGRGGMRRGGAWSLGYEQMMDRMMGQGEEEDEEDEEEEEEARDGMMMRGIGEEDMEIGRLIRHMMEAGKDKQEIMKMMMMKQCKGDKGGPLVAKKNGQWYLIGVTSLPYGCMHQGSPALFSQVDILKDWVKPIFNDKYPKGKSKYCEAGEFSCGDGWCIPEEQRCDGQNDCTLATDEHFCKGAIKGYNVYFDQAIDNGTESHKFAVHSPEQCALACFKAPFLCPGFDVYVLPDSMMMPQDVPTMMSMAEDMSDVMDDDEEEEEEMEDDMGMKKIPKIVCKLADTVSTVHHKNSSLMMMKKKMMMMMDETAEKDIIHFHFKLPRPAPLAALLSPKLNLRLPTGLIVSPSYILGKNLSHHIGDHRLSLMLIKSVLVEKLVDLAYKACFMHHEHAHEIENIVMWFNHLARMASEMDHEMMMMMSRMNEMDEDKIMMEMMQMKHNMTWAVEHAKELHMNYTMLVHEVMMSCNRTNITHHVHDMLKGLLANYTCDKDEGMGDEMGGMEDMMKVFQMLIKKLELHNMYKLDIMMKMMMKKKGMMGGYMDKGDDMGNMEGGEMMSGGMGMGMMTEAIMDRGSMLGDIWSFLGSDDLMSMTMMDEMTGMMGEEGMMMEEGKMKKNITVMKHEVVMKIKKIARMLMMASCKNMSAKMGMMGMGGMMDMGMGGDIGGDMGMMGGDMSKMGMHNLTDEQSRMMKAMKMMQKMSQGHHKWTIMQSPHRTNNIHFRVLDSRGPYHCDNVPKDFGLMVARGGYMPVPMLIKKEIMRMKAKMMTKGVGMMSEMMMEKMGEEVMHYMASMMPPEMMQMMMMMGEEGMGGEMGDMQDKMSYMMDMVFEMMMGENMMGEGMMGEGMMGEGMMGEGMMGRGMEYSGTEEGGDMMEGGERENIMSPEQKKYFYAKIKEIVKKMKMKEGRGVTKCLSELKEKKVLWVEGSHALIDQYTNKVHSHGVVMEYGSGFKCDQTFTDGTGVLTSPMFPKKYPSNVACNHMIVAPPGHVIMLVMMHFNTQWQAHCMHDSLTVFDYDAESEDWAKLGSRSFCGTKVPHVFRSSGQKMHVKFESDQSGEESGFLAKYFFAPEYATESMPMPLFPGEPTDRTPGEPNEMDRATLERLWHAEDEAETYKISLIVVACVLGAVLIISMVVMYNHYNRKIKKLSDDGIEKTKF